MTALSNNYSRRDNGRYKGRGKMDESQKKAMVVQVILGRRFQESHPEIADFFREGYFKREIIEKLRLYEIEGLEEQNIPRAIFYTLNGFKGNAAMKLDSYEGLLNENEDEKKEIVREHQVSSGLEMKANRTGIFALSEDERKEASCAGGKKAYENRVGVHSYTPKERTANGKKAAMARGNIPITEPKGYNIGELEFVRRLSFLLEFKHAGPRLKGKNNIELIREKTNKAFNNSRSSDSIRWMIKKANKSG